MLINLPSSPYLVNVDAIIRVEETREGRINIYLSDGDVIVKKMTKDEFLAEVKMQLTKD